LKLRGKQIEGIKNGAHSKTTPGPEFLRIVFS
jgi:hypothetical protein